MYVRKELIEQIKKFPSKAQKEAEDFVQFLSEKYLEQEKDDPSLQNKSVLESSFRGIWKDREDLENSTQWVRNIRKSRWAS